MTPPMIFEAHSFQSLLDVLHQRGYQVMGPTIRDGAIVYDALSRVDDLPIGWTEVQDGGTYRLTRRADNALFGYVVGPHSWKQFLHPPQLRLWQAQRQAHGFQIVDTPDVTPIYAFIGVRACELHAMAIQDKVFLAGAHIDPTYAARREPVFIVAINCGQAGGTCFCVSMQTGPRASSGFDLALTEVLEAEQHYFLTEVGSTWGAAILRDVPHHEAQPEHLAMEERTVARTATQMGRSLDTADIKELLYRN